MTDEMPELLLDKCDNFCLHDGSSNALCRACNNRQNTTEGVFMNIAKRMTNDSHIDYPKWLFVYVQDGLEAARSTPAPVTDAPSLKISHSDRLKINSTLWGELKKLENSGAEISAYKCDIDATPSPAPVTPAADIPNCEHGYAYNDCPFYNCTHWDMGI